MSYDSEKTKEHIEWMFPRWNVSIFKDSGEYILEKKEEGLVFRDIFDLINEVGLDLVYVGSFNDRVQIIVKDRRS